MKRSLDAILPLALIGLFALVGMSGPREAAAYTDVAVVVSTAMSSRVIVTTGTTIRIDNWNKGAQCTTSSCLLSGRVNVCVQNLDTADEIHIDWTSDVSDDETNADVGEKVLAGDKACKAATRGLALHAIAPSAAGAGGVAVYIEQLGVNQ